MQINSLSDLRKAVEADTEGRWNALGVLDAVERLTSATPPDVAGLVAELENSAAQLPKKAPAAILYRQAATALRLSAGGGWRTMDSAPELDRVIVAGWQKPTRSCAGYWWMHEDVIINGQPDERPDALLWHPFPSRPAGLPACPTVEAGQ